LGEAFELEIIADGERALQVIHEEREREKGERPCVVLLDLHLPRHDGLEVLRAIRQEPVMNHIHVVIMTTSISPQQDAELKRLGVGYRLKPKDISEYEALAGDIIAICKGQVVPTASA